MRESGSNSILKTQGHGSILTTQPMKRSLQVPIAPGRKIGAWVCLLALALLWTPLWAAAWQAHGMECCEGGMCAAHGHTKSNRTQPQQSGPSKAPMNCEHHGAGGISSCSISCCHESNSSFAVATIFVLPVPTTISQPAQGMAAFSYFARSESLLKFEPLSPPPRSSLFSL